MDLPILRHPGKHVECLSANRRPCRSLASPRHEAAESLGRAIGRKLLGCDGARRLSSTSREVRFHPGRTGTTRLAPRACARQHGLGASPRRHREPCRCREIVRRAACRRRELHGAAQLNSVEHERSRDFVCGPASVVRRRRGGDARAHGARCPGPCPEQDVLS